MKVDKTISNKFVRVDMTPQEYDAFVQILKLQRKDYKGGKWCNQNHCIHKRILKSRFAQEISK